MYKNLNARVLGISGRQSDLIELAMTYGFQGVDVDAVDLQRRVARTDMDKATRFLTSSGLRVSGFEVPCDLDADDKEFDAALSLVEQVVGVAGVIKARAGFLLIPPASDRAPFPQYFEWVKSRIVRLASIFEKHQVLLGLCLSTFSEDRKDRQYSFIQDVDGALALMQSIGSKSVGLVVDSFHWTVGKGTWEQLATLPGNQVAGLNIADLESLPELKDSSEGLKLIAGTVGTIDNARFVKTLVANGYDGPITSYPGISNLGSIKRDAIVAKAQDVLDATLTRAGLATQTRRPELVAAQASFGPDLSSIEELG